MWTVPSGRMKAHRECRVPLCRRPLDILNAARGLGAGASPFGFTTGDGEMLDEVLRGCWKNQQVAPCLKVSGRRWIESPSCTAQ